VERNLPSRRNLAEFTVFLSDVIYEQCSLNIVVEVSDIEVAFLQSRDDNGL
jgi:hypothetical protein